MGHLRRLLRSQTLRVSLTVSAAAVTPTGKLARETTGAQLRSTPRTDSARILRQTHPWEEQHHS